MKICIPIRRVADTTAKVTIAADGSSINEAGIKFVLNPYDEFALEAGLALKEGAGAGEVVALAFGRRLCAGDAPDRARDGRRQCGAPAGDTVARRTGQCTGDRRSRPGGGYDLVLFGKLAVDDYNQQTGPMMAELLGLPCATAITSLSACATASRPWSARSKAASKTATCSLPAVFTCDKGLNTPRLPSLKGIMAAKKKPLEVVPTSAGAGKARGGVTCAPARARRRRDRW